MLKKEERRQMNERFWKMFKRSMRKTHSLSEKKSVGSNIQQKLNTFI